MSNFFRSMFAKSLVLGVVVWLLYIQLVNFLSWLFFSILTILFPREAFWDPLWSSIKHPQTIYELFVLAPVFLGSTFLAAAAIAISIGLFYRWQYDERFVIYTSVVFTVIAEVFLDASSYSQSFTFLILHVGFVAMLWFGLAKGFIWQRKMKGEY